MGYTTQFQGELKFKTELTASQLAKVQSMCGEDCRDHPEWNRKDLYYIDLELTKDFSGLKWSGAEKTYDMCDLVNVVTAEMRKEWPAFQLVGSLHAQGEEIEDRWVLRINEDGIAEKKEIVIEGQRVVCPHCEQKFILETQTA